MLTYHTSAASKRRVTIVGRTAVTPEGKQVLEIAMAKCNSKDQFKRKLGCTIAKGRLEKNKIDKIIDIPVEGETSQLFLNTAKQTEKEFFDLLDSRVREKSKTRV